MEHFAFVFAALICCLVPVGVRLADAGIVEVVENAVLRYQKSVRLEVTLQTSDWLNEMLLLIDGQMVSRLHRLPTVDLIVVVRLDDIAYIFLRIYLNKERKRMISSMYADSWKKLCLLETLSLRVLEPIEPLTPH